MLPTSVICVIENPLIVGCLASDSSWRVIWKGLECLSVAGLLHWFTSPYIHRMVYHRKTGMVDLESLTMLARPRRDSFHVAAAAYPQTLKPQATFQVSSMTHVQHDSCAAAHAFSQYFLSCAIIQESLADSLHSGYFQWTFP